MKRKGSAVWKDGIRDGQGSRIKVIAGDSAETSR